MRQMDTNHVILATSHNYKTSGGSEDALISLMQGEKGMEGMVS